MSDNNDLLRRYSDEIARNARLERTLDNDLHFATGQFSAKADVIRNQLEINNDRAQEMPWYERAFTYTERRHERQELLKELDLAEAVHQIADTLRGTLQRYEQSRDQAQRGLSPERSLTRELRRDRSDDLDLGR